MGHAVTHFLSTPSDVVRRHTGEGGSVRASKGCSRDHQNSRLLSEHLFERLHGTAEQVPITLA